MATIDDLTFTLLDDGSGYSVKATSTSISGDLEIPSSYNGLPVKSIGTTAFSDCKGLTSVTIPSSVTSIGPSAFQHCSGLTSVTIPSSVTNIGTYAFTSCYGLTLIKIPSSVTKISDGMFSYCVGLTSITIPSSITTIRNFAFVDCTNLEYFKFDGNAIPESSDVLSNTPNLECVYVNYDATGWGSTWDGKTVVIDPASYFSFTLSSDGTYYSVKAKNTSISGELEIPAEYNGLPVKTIEDVAFDGCSSLTSIKIPSSVTGIRSYAFSNCIGLTSISIPSSVKFVEVGAFYKCSGLTSVTMSSSLIDIGSSAFRDCTELTYFKFEGNAVVEPSNIFNNTPNLECVYVNNSATGWGETWGGKPVVKVSSIGNAVKYGETSLIEIKLGEITIYSMFIGDDQLF